MNPAEQRSHKTITDQLKHDLAESVDETAKALVAVGVRLDAHESAIAALTTSVESVIPRSVSNLTRAITDRSDEMSGRIGDGARDFRAFTSRGFWSRLNWLLTGR